MSPETFIVIMSMMVLVMAWYANTSKRNKILCRFRRVNKTLIAKWVSMKSMYIIFDNKKYDIIPSRIIFQWYNSGFVHMLFPQYVATLDYTWGKRLPLDPNNFDYDWDNPENRKAINISEIISSYMKTSSPTANKKQAMLQMYLPWIVLGIAVLGMFYLYNNQQWLAQQMAIMQNSMNAITK